MFSLNKSHFLTEKSYFNNYSSSLPYKENNTAQTNPVFKNFQSLPHETSPSFLNSNRFIAPKITNPRALARSLFQKNTLHLILTSLALNQTLFTQHLVYFKISRKLSDGREPNIILPTFSALQPSWHTFDVTQKNARGWHITRSTDDGGGSSLFLCLGVTQSRANAVRNSDDFRWPVMGECVCAGMSPPSRLPSLASSRASLLCAPLCVYAGISARSATKWTHVAGVYAGIKLKYVG